MPVIPYFHGNAMHLGARAARFRAFAQAGYGVFALSYRGYGRSEGSPSEQGLYNDARAAIVRLQQQPTHPRIILHGESPGSGVAAEMAEEYSVSGLVLQSAYTSVTAVAAEDFWYLPGTRYLVRDRFDSLSKMQAIHCPVLIVHGDRDTVIPYAHGRMLAEKANAPKYFMTVHGAGHLNIADTTLLNAMTHFFRQ